MPRAKRREIAEVGVCHQDDVAARPAVTAVRPALRHVLLAPQVDAAVAAAPRLHLDAGAVLEHVDLLGLTVDFDEAAFTALSERHGAGTLCEDRVVATDPGAVARTESRPALSHEDHPGLDLLTGEDLHAEHLRVRVASVARRAESFFVRHL